MELLHQFLGPDLAAAGLAILNLVLIESLLSVDNAAVLATMVMDLPEKQRARALRIGLFVGYFLRGGCILLASWLMQIKWLAILGGAYLLYLSIQHFYSKYTKTKEDDLMDKSQNPIYRRVVGKIGLFWATVIQVELMDLMFSIDNVFAALTFAKGFDDPYKLRLVIIGVFIGILAMRLVAGLFVRLMSRFPFLEVSAFIVVGLLGIKLILSEGCHYFPDLGICHYMEGKTTNLIFSLATLVIFGLPLLTSILFNFPKRKPQEEIDETANSGN